MRTPKTERFRDIVSRLRMIPSFLQQAASNLLSTRDVVPVQRRSKTKATSIWWMAS
jgi:hypothetical protein